MKQITLPWSFLEFTWLVIDGFMEENSLALFLKKGPTHYRTFQEVWNFCSPYYKICSYYNWSHFFYCLFEIHINYFLYAQGFLSPTWKKSPPLKVPIVCKPYEKWLTNPPPHHPGEMWTMKSLWICQDIFLIILKL